MAEASFWDHHAFVAAPTAHRLQLGDRSALFCARRQQLYELNATADGIWLALVKCGTPAGAAETLDHPQALEFVRQAAEAWMRGGLLAPTAATAALHGRPKAELGFSLDTLRLTIRICGDATPEPVLSVFGQFASDAVAERSLTAAGLGGLIFLFDGEQPLGAWTERTWIPELKGRVTELYARAVDAGFLAHAALLVRNGEGLLICGDPGAGKTTLSAALAANGFEYQADDVVRIDEIGRAFGAPFAPALKSGAWPLLRNTHPVVDSLPIYQRSDGQEVRYLPAPAATRRCVPIGAVLLLARGHDVGPEVQAAAPMDVLTTILGSAYSSQASIDADTLKALAAAVNEARLGRLVFTDLDEALPVISAFVA